MPAEIFEDDYDLFHRLMDYEKELVQDAITVSREFGGPCVISPDGIMIHTKSYSGNVFYGLITDVNKGNMEYAARELFDAMRNAGKIIAITSIKKTA